MPDWRAYVKSKLPPLGLGPGREAEIVDELTQELEQCYAGALARGASEEEAVRAATQEVPDWAALAREIRTAEGPSAPAPEPLGAEVSRGRSRLATALGRDLVQDVRYGLRALAQVPQFKNCDRVVSRG